MAEPRNRTRTISGGSKDQPPNGGWFGMATRPVGEALSGARSRNIEEDGDRSTVKNRDTSVPRSSSRAEGSVVGMGSGRSAPARKVRTIPPFASADPPSPPTSPKFGPTTGSHVSRPSTSTTTADAFSRPINTSTFTPFHTLNPVQSNSTHDLRGPSIFGSDHDPSDPDVTQDQWWTFALPGKHQAFRGLQAAWNGTMQANKELREESEHYGRDYFSPKAESAGAQPGAGEKTPGFGGAMPMGFSFGPRASGDAGLPPGTPGGGGAGGPLKQARCKALSLPGSRRHSMEGIPRMGRSDKSVFGKARRSPVTEKPMETSEPPTATPPSEPLSADRAVPTTPPRRPASVHGDSLLGKHPPKPKPKIKKPFHITLPEPTFGNEPLVVVPSHILRAQAPPTPIGWDRPWQAGLQGYRSKQAQLSAGAQPIPDSPWTRAAHPDAPWNTMEEEATSNGLQIAQRDSNSTTAVGTDSTGRSNGQTGKKSGWLRTGKKDLIKRRVVTVVEQPKTRAQRIRQFWIFDAKAALGVKIFGMMSLACALGMSISVRALDHETGTDGIIGSSPVLTIIYAPPTIIHLLITMYREAFGRPIGLWGMRSKMIWVCFDLFFICVWASDLSLCISDFLTTPLLCSNASPWWTSYASQAIALSPLAELYQDRICSRQAALISFVLLATMVYVANMVLSLFRILERLATLHKAYEMRRDQGHAAQLA